jgi:hypothetical protein
MLASQNIQDNIELWGINHLGERRLNALGKPRVALIANILARQRHDNDGHGLLARETTREIGGLQVPFPPEGASHFQARVLQSRICQPTHQSVSKDGTLEYIRATLQGTIEM